MRPESGWASARRLEELAGEARVNLLRLVALAAFYGHHLVNVFLLPGGPPTDGAFHREVTLVVLAWGLVALVVAGCVRGRVVPLGLKYVSTLADVLLATALLVIAADPRTMYGSLYFLIIAASALRLSLPLVYTATGASVAAYLFYLGFVRWGLALPEEQRLPRAQQVVMVLSLVVAGLLAGQVVRQCRRVWLGHGVLLLDPPADQPSAAK
ncbi:MAG: hypothetical protein U0797_25720 [Gemmataceae bacterium]